MKDDLKNIFTIPLLMQRWNLEASELLKKLHADRRAVYVWLKGETIFTGHSTKGEREDICQTLDGMRRFGVDVQAASHYVCKDYEPLQLMQLKKILSSFSPSDDYIEIKELEEDPFPRGKINTIVNYRSMPNPVQVKLTRVFCFAEHILQHERSKSISVNNSIKPIYLTALNETRPVRKGKSQPKLDYKYWASVSKCTLEAAALLIHKINPDSYREINFKGIPSSKEGEKVFRKKELNKAFKTYCKLCNHFWGYDTNAMAYHQSFYPRVIISFAVDAGLCNPDHELAVLLIIPPIAPTSITTSQNDKQAKGGSQAQRADNNLIKIIAALLSMYKEDLSEPAKFAIVLEEATEKLGCRVGKDTIMTNIREAKKHIDRTPAEPHIKSSN